DVLDAGAPLALDIDPGLDREGVPGPQGLAVAADEVGVLVLLEADAVARAVHEVGPVPALGDQPAGDRVDVLARCTDHCGSHGLGLGPLENGVQVAEL